MLQFFYFTILLLGRVAAENGTTFFVVGDYGRVTALETPNMVFDAMNEVIGAGVYQSIDKPEFIITTGDNIYPAVGNAPTAEEFRLMVGLFNRTNIADLPVYAIRGNHDSYFDWTDELQLTME